MHEGEGGILDDLEPDDHHHENHHDDNNDHHHHGAVSTRRVNSETLVKIFSGVIVSALIGIFLYIRFFS